MAKIKLQIKNRLTGSILFEYEKENNTIKDTLIEAVKDEANLYEANLYGANLRGANLYGANLYGADLRGADLRGANLREADLREADLRGANLREADLREADLRGADLREAKEIPYIPLACPSDGAFVGWKKAEGKLIKLLIPEDAKRSSATTQKCRCSKAQVVEITDLDGTNPVIELNHLAYDIVTTYKVGEIVLPDSFDEDRWNECSNGIHFFINKQDAIDYY